MNVRKQKASEPKCIKRLIFAPYGRLKAPPPVDLVARFRTCKIVIYSSLLYPCLVYLVHRFPFPVPTAWRLPPRSSVLCRLNYSLAPCWQFRFYELYDGWPTLNVELFSLVGCSFQARVTSTTRCSFVRARRAQKLVQRTAYTL